MKYSLKDRELQKKLDDLTDGDFSKRLREALQKTPCQAGWNKNVLFGFS
jgi:hypothetical protein